MWHTFNQNNSWGVDKGPAQFVCVEGDSLDDITRRAESVGIYFGGRDDCPCCGDRWEPIHKKLEDLDDSPLVFGNPPEKLDGIWEHSSVLIMPKGKPERWINKPE